MGDIEYLSKLLKHLVGLLKQAVTIQGETRKQLRTSLEALANNFEIACKEALDFKNLVLESSDTPNKVLEIVKNGCYMYGDTFESDDQATQIERVRRRLYGGEAPTLIDRFKSALDPLRYSVEITNLSEIQKDLGTMQDFDFRTADEFELFLRAVRDAAQNSDSKRVKKICAEFEESISAIATEFRGVSRGVEI